MLEETSPPEPPGKAVRLWMTAQAGSARVRISGGGISVVSLRSAPDHPAPPRRLWFRYYRNPIFTVVTLLVLPFAKGAVIGFAWGARRGTESGGCNERRRLTCITLFSPYLVFPATRLIPSSGDYLEGLRQLPAPHNLHPASTGPIADASILPSLPRGQ